MNAQDLFLCQVFALSTLGDHIYFRTDVTPNELVGRTWKVVHMSRPVISCSEATSMDTVSSEGSSSYSETANESKLCYLFYYWKSCSVAPYVFTLMLFSLLFFSRIC